MPPLPPRLRPPTHGGSAGTRLAAPVLLAAAVALVGGAEARGESLPEGALIPLQCRLGSGPWRPCQMQVQQVGTHWFLLIGEQRLEFRHDGTGAVRMQSAGSGWRSVRSRWEPDTSLCWDGVCARGDLPLD